MSERLPSHPFAAFTLEKISLATHDALTLIANVLEIPRTALSAAGLKDRHAITKQVITIDSAAFRGRIPHEAHDQAWRLTRLGFTNRAADATIIAGNAFSIVVRNLNKRHTDELVRRAETLVDSGSGDLLFVNYFGDQRFGSARHGEGFVGRALIDGDFEKAVKLAIGTPARKDSGPLRTLTRALATHWGDWPTALAACPRLPERGAVETLARGGDFKEAFTALPKFTQDICVEAYQSFLWNAIARELSHALAETTAQRAFEAEDLFGPLIFPRATALTPAFRELGISMPSPRSEMPECLSEIVAGIFEDEGISFDMLRIPGVQRPYFGGGDRPFIARARGWSISEPFADEFAGGGSAVHACKLSFELPRGAYATVLLRALGQ